MNLMSIPTFISYSNYIKVIVHINFCLGHYRHGQSSHNKMDEQDVGVGCMSLKK